MLSQKYWAINHTLTDYNAMHQQLCDHHCSSQAPCTMTVFDSNQCDTFLAECLYFSGQCLKKTHRMFNGTDTQTFFSLLSFHKMCQTNNRCFTKLMVMTNIFYQNKCWMLRALLVDNILVFVKEKQWKTSPMD